MRSVREQTTSKSLTGNEYVTKDSGKRAEFETGARRDCAEGKGRYDLAPVLAIKRLMALYERGAVKYAARNWEKGIPVPRMFDSGLRHALQALAGECDEDHLAGAVFNLLGIMEFEERVKLGLMSPTLFEGMGSLYEFNRGAKSALDRRTRIGGGKGSTVRRIIKVARSTKRRAAQSDKVLSRKSVRG